MSLLHSLYRSNSAVSTLASISIHFAVGVLLCLGLAKYFNGSSPLKKPPPVLSVSFHQSASDDLPATTVTTLESVIVPPRNETPQVNESPLERPVETIHDEEQLDVAYQEVRPWMPSHLRVRPAVKPVVQPSLTPPTEEEVAAVVVEVAAYKDAQQCPPPTYPRTARAKNQQGTVTLLVVIREDGQVTTVQVHASSGHKKLDDAALAAVRTWKYVPATAAGQPHASVILQSIVFEIEKS
jgi:protein TonB